jgi:hypothetical protein
MPLADLHKELSGHVANRLQAAVMREVYYLVGEGVLSVADVDTALCWGPGLRWARDPDLGEVPHIRTPIKIGEDVRVRTVAPKLGQHNAEIFGRLGVSEAEMQRLHTKGVL